MRARVGLGVALFGALLALLGIALMVVLGPDGSVTSGPHDVETDGIAIVTAPEVLSWAGLQMTVLAELPVNKPVFVGLGNTVDVDNYIKGTKHLEVDSFHLPWQVHTRVMKGRDNMPAAPTALDWWLADSAGLGGASIDTTLPDQTVSLAILSVGFSNLKGLKVTVGYGIKGGFVLGGGIALLGAGGILFGRVLRRGDGWWREAAVDDGDDEEFDDVRYVYVDEDGVEHEISEAELVDYEIVDDEIVDDAAFDNGEDNRP